jgi:uncharacterized membrane protein
MTAHELNVPTRRIWQLPAFVMIMAWAAAPVVLMPASTVHAGDPGAAVQEISDIQVVSPGEAEGKPAGLADLVGRMHPALVHFPIAWLLGLVVVDFVGLILKRETGQRAGLFVLGATVLSLLPTATTGFLRAVHMAPDPSLHSLLVTHRTLNIAVAALLVIALCLRAVRRNDLQAWSRIVYLGLVFVAAGLVLVAADFGGRMVYGPNYLPW